MPQVSEIVEAAFGELLIFLPDNQIHFMIDFTLVSAVENIEVIAVNRGIRDLARLNREFGRGRWRKLKGTAYVKLENGRVRLAEVHWYEAHGIGRRDMKIKKYVYE